METWAFLHEFQCQLGTHFRRGMPRRQISCQLLRWPAYSSHFSLLTHHKIWKALNSCILSRLPMGDRFQKNKMKEKPTVSIPLDDDPLISMWWSTVDGDDGLSSGMNCCNECVCVDPWCVCSDRSRFGCFKGCGFCQCYDKPERTCYCVDVLKRCPPPCILTPDGPSPPPAAGW